MEDMKLLEKYNIPVPRYTSYPTVPYWNDRIDVEAWSKTFTECFRKNNADGGISLYIHLPFCESLCTYCGCNKKITTNHGVEAGYIEAILKEWQMYLALVDGKPVIKELHLGGGTPTFFSTDNLTRLVTGILDNTRKVDDVEFSFEGHPNNTTREHLQTLFDLGFSRVSFGVQDNDPEVQRVINRIQPFENVAAVTATAREIGYRSVNFDLIYGLPLQHLEGMRKTIADCISLKPDRVAFYSYAHVPWTSRGQRLFDENDLPAAELKLRLYAEGKKLFTAAGYSDIGMDHFALPGDYLHQAWQAGGLHRNFMGYTTQKTKMMIGLGVSAISDLGCAFGQNTKTIQDYYRSVDSGHLPVQKGIVLNDEDVLFRKYILDLSCNGHTVFAHEYYDVLKEFTFPQLAALEADGLIEWTEHEVKLTGAGKQFLRVVCRTFDLHLLRSVEADKSQMFSKAV
ncbi:MAG: hemN [Flavipsychrobacter sp.]|nr:hemN [Flavipsychrobacter sp.]